MTTNKPSNWPIILLAVAAGVITAMQVGKVLPALPIIAEDLELSRFMAGLVASMFFVFGAVIGVAVGGLVDRFGERLLLFIGLALLTVGSLLGGLIVDSDVLLATRALEGVGYIAVTVSAPKMILGAAKPADVPNAIAIWSTFMPLGMAVIMLFSPMMLAGISWQGVWLVNAVALAVFAGILALGLHHSPWQAKRRSDCLTSRLTRHHTTFAIHSSAVITCAVENASATRLDLCSSSPDNSP